MARSLNRNANRLRAVKRCLMASALIVLASIVRDASGAGVIYTYDLAGRVTTALYDNGLCIAYVYDANGNRTAQTNSTPGPPAWGSGAWGCFSWTP